MSIEKKPDYIKLKKFYKGYFLTEFKEDYYHYRTVIRLINSYVKNPHKNKTHDIYNRIVILHRVFDKGFINNELLEICDNEYKKSYLKFLLNELFKSKYKIENSKDYWKKDIDILINSGSIRKM